ncbi:hypothetical protein A8C56_03030 [Niabella ginsenosidivorans]|uniref:RNA polymerase subunit sigma-24 n=1 Tax=Niabella ginsenosidivorans TaxID=1176587 RepID=A0A1A9I0L2_9BACT|nr:sigma-70 family RNA polymerase sigma factor [Niabella ginsenosidivorans]ANH80094.1 hypothetical protein A8C56_03030 [Niabella ginsenosidivorans]
MAQQQDDIIVERLKNNDVTAFDELYLKYFKLLCASAYFFIKDEGDAKDLVQNFFLDIWEKRLFEHFHKDVKGYLFLSVKNRCLNFIKSRKVKERRSDAFRVTQEIQTAGTEEEADHPQSNERLLDLLSDMKGQKKAALTMVYFNGKKYREAANEMGIGINSLKTHLKSALKMLRIGMMDKKN